GGGRGGPAAAARPQAHRSSPEPRRSPAPRHGAGRSADRNPGAGTPGGRCPRWSPRPTRETPPAPADRTPAGRTRRFPPATRRRSSGGARDPSADPRAGGAPSTPAPPRRSRRSLDAGDRPVRESPRPRPKPSYEAESSAVSDVGRGGPDPRGGNTRAVLSSEHTANYRPAPRIAARHAAARQSLASLPQVAAQHVLAIHALEVAARCHAGVHV